MSTAKDVRIILGLPKEDWQTIYLIMLDTDEYHHIAIAIADALKEQVGWRL